MLVKLLKYEMKASARTLIPLYIAILAVAVACGVQMTILMKPIAVSGSQITFSSLLFLALFGLCIATGVLTLMTIVQRFNASLIGDEGYLMFTLPVTHTQLLSSKLIGAVLWSVIGVVVMALAAGIILAFSMISLSSGVYFADLPPMLPFSAIYGFVQMTATILMIYFSIMVAQTERFSHHRVAVAVVLFFTLNWLFDGVAGLLLGTSAIPDISLLSDQFMQAYYWQMCCLVAYKLVQCVILFIGTKWMMQNKLNL